MLQEFLERRRFREMLAHTTSSYELSYHVGFATHDDLPILAEIHYLHTPSMPVSLHHNFLQMTQSKVSAGLLKAVKADEIKGFLGFDFTSQTTASITHLYARQERQGIGSVLLDRFFETAQAVGLQEVTVHTSAKGRDFYEKSGFWIDAQGFAVCGVEEYRRSRQPQEKTIFSRL